MRTTGYRAERLKTDFRTGILDPSPVLSLADGSLDVTGRPLDLAIQGPGFFVVDVGGREMLTRNGQFHIDASRQLVDASGNPVMGQSGPIALSRAGVHINAGGEILDGGRSVGNLRIVAVAAPDALREAGDGLYTYTGMPAQWNGSIHQGALEKSNVDAGTEMVRLMELTRHAQSMQRALQAYDQAMQFGVNHIGENT
ncbi:MAG: flagellar hook basal-body protein [Xanthomonadaceae bacterium]|nr:flagellar hook basal-body protein [Xanthomonadaceae bacterium]